MEVREATAANPVMKLVARPVYVMGVLIAVVGFGLLHAGYMAPEPYRFVGSPASGWWTVYIVAHLVMSYALGLPELAVTRWAALGRGLAATIAAFVVISGMQALLATPLLPRSSSMLVGLVLPLWTVFAWNIAVDSNAWAAARDRVFLVVDSDEDLDALRRDLARDAERPATLVGSIPLDQVLAAGRRDRIVEAAGAARATVLVTDTASRSHARVIEQAQELHRNGVRMRTLALFYEDWIGKLPHSELGPVSLLFDIGELHRIRYVRAKRVIDLSFGLLGLAVLIPVAAVVWVLNHWSNPGPLFYSQPRVGRDGKVFVIYKLRTMTSGSEHNSSWTAIDDARITPLGGLLRRTHLDELPQTINILKGDLSLVGPRPEQPHYVEELKGKIAFYDVRHIVRPGLTGWAQVKQGYAADHADAFDKLQYDVYYLRRQGVTLDARIIWRTLRGVVGGDGR